MYILFNLIAVLITQTLANTIITENKIEQDASPMYVASGSQLPKNAYELEIIDLLGIGDRQNRFKKMPTIRNSASNFLLEIYQEITKEEQEISNVAYGSNRPKRNAHADRLITQFDRMEIEQCNNIITFSSKKIQTPPASHNRTTKFSRADVLLQFNINDVLTELQLVHADLRLYQDSALGKYSNTSERNVSISIYQKMHNRKQQSKEFRILDTLNSTTTHKGWLKFNVTQLLSKWLQRRSTTQINELLVNVALRSNNDSGVVPHFSELSVSDIGVVSVPEWDDQVKLQPFIVGYFNGPDLVAKIQKLRFKRELMKRKRRADYIMRSAAPLPEVYHTPKTCERLNFTLDFKDLHMHNWIIAPKKFEAYFCGGECNFPLNSHMNATNHAIVQTLMHLKQPNLPKPCCVPTVLGSISILHYLNDDSVNLSKYPQSVAKECGCH